jgi:hypothetical protein
MSASRRCRQLGATSVTARGRGQACKRSLRRRSPRLERVVARDGNTSVCNGRCGNPKEARGFATATGFTRHAGPSSPTERSGPRHGQPVIHACVGF